MAGVIYTASFYQPENWVGVRYRISRAHPRGKTTDWQVQPYLYPSRPLLREYQGGAIDFMGFDARYREELENTLQSVAGFQEWLDGLAATGDFTLLCFEPQGEPCHRRLATAWLLERLPDLQLGQMR